MALVATVVQEISIGHPAVKDVLAIQRNSAPNRFRLAILDGLWAVGLAVDGPLRVDTFFLCPDLFRSDDAKNKAEALVKKARRSFRVSRKTFERMAERDSPDGLLATVEMPRWEPSEFRPNNTSIAVVADGIEIPGNLGTLFRTLDACAADLLVMTNRRTRLSHPKVIKGSRGMSLFIPSMEFETVGEAAAHLARYGYTVYLADTDAKLNYREVSYPNRVAIVVGNERYGVSKEWYEAGAELIKVPMLGVSDSLNVSVSASVMMYEVRAQASGWSPR